MILYFIIYKVPVGLEVGTCVLVYYNTLIKIHWFLYKKKKNVEESIEVLIYILYIFKYLYIILVLNFRLWWR